MTARVGLHHDDAHLAHDVPRHPEQPDRIPSILGRLEETGVRQRLLPLPERLATDADLQLVHTPNLIDFLRRLDATGGGRIDPDTSVRPGSVEAAVRAVGGALAAVDAVLGGEMDAAFCIDRPPGHHATPKQAMGFCLFNQIAIAARYAQQRHGVERVAILDIDVHHGNGTQDAFDKEPRILYASTHEYPFYPGTGHWSETGAGNLVNLSLPAGSGNDEYAAAWSRVIEPAVHRFRPELILVSAGFDAHLADPLADMALTEPGYARIAATVRALAEEYCGGRSIWILEGGYRLEALARSVEAVTRVLLGDAVEQHQPAAPRSDVGRLLERIAELHGLPAAV